MRLQAAVHQTRVMPLYKRRDHGDTTTELIRAAHRINVAGTAKSPVYPRREVRRRFRKLNEWGQSVRRTRPNEVERGRPSSVTNDGLFELSAVAARKVHYLLVHTSLLPSETWRNHHHRVKTALGPHTP